MLKFSLHYYGKFNFSRKEALEIQRNITKMIISPIAQVIKKFLIIIKHLTTKQNIH